jgi:hypothetical protein
MELMQFLMETIIAWARDVAINVSGRVIEEFVGKRRNRPRKTKQRRKRAQPSREGRSR